MKSNVLTISLPSNGECTKNCPYCVSKMTEPIETNVALWQCNLSCAKLIAEKMGVTSILITSKTEPMDNQTDLIKVLQEFKYWPIELQTNGESMLKIKGIIPCDSNGFKGLKTIAISIDDPLFFESGLAKGLINGLWNYGYLMRAAIVLTDRFDGIDLDWLITNCIKFGFHQLTIRLASAPKNIVNTPEGMATAAWIINHSASELYHDMEIELTAMIVLGKTAHKIRQLPFGPWVYDIRGIGVTMMPYCIEERAIGDNVRALIYQEDGHMYTSWNALGSILF